MLSISQTLFPFMIILVIHDYFIFHVHVIDLYLHGVTDRNLPFQFIYYRFYHTTSIEKKA